MNRAPSVKRLCDALGICEGQALIIRGLIRDEIDPEFFPETAEWVRRCYNRPSDVELVMHAINFVIGGYGCEAIWAGRCRWPRADYVNTGDTYSATILYDYDSDAYQLTTFGDFVERNRI